MITFNGSQKEFFKAYPMEKRSLNEVYKLINSTGETLYKFIKTTGEKNFKKVTEKELTNETEKKDDSKVSSKAVELKPAPKEDVQEKVNKKEDICNRLEKLLTNAVEKTRQSTIEEETTSRDSMNYHEEDKCIREQVERRVRALRICFRNGWFRHIKQVAEYLFEYAHEHFTYTYIKSDELFGIVKEIEDNNYFNSTDTDQSSFERNYQCCESRRQADEEMLRERVVKGTFYRIDEKYPEEVKSRYARAAVRELERCYERIEHLEDLLKQVEDIAKTRDNCSE